MARKHECPDCGASHELDAAGRIERLEERVRELEAKQHVCPHPHWYWSNTTYPLTITSGTADTTSTLPQITYTSS